MPTPFPSLFKRYDIRGPADELLHDDLAYRIGCAYADWLRPSRVAIGGDSRLSTAALQQAVTDGLLAHGCDVVDLGLAGSEEVYFAVCQQQLCGGIVVTASHNPAHHNGFKLVQRMAQPIAAGSGLEQIAARLQKPSTATPRGGGKRRKLALRDTYIAHLCAQIEPRQLQPMRLLFNSGHGAAGPVLETLCQALTSGGAELQWRILQQQPDGRFPGGVPNPQLPSRRADTAAAVSAEQADMGIAFDGDFDRCFLFDKQGCFVPNYYLIGLLAERMLQRYPDRPILHDRRLYWQLQQIVQKHGGKAIATACGHSPFKHHMRALSASYGGECSGHHYFRDFFYCDSGMLPWLLIWEICSQRQQSLAEMVAAAQAAWPCSEEINFATSEDAATVFARLRRHFAARAISQDDSDGLDLCFQNWRFNLRASGTESLLRLNIESRHQPQLKPYIDQLSQLIKGRTIG